MTDHVQPTPPPPAPAGPRAAVVVLSALAVLLAGASVLAIVLFLGAREDLGLEVRRLDETSRSLTGAQDRLEETRTSTEAVAGRISTLEAENAELRECAEPAKDSIIAARDDDDAALGPAVARATEHC
ncbi:hypothetical protein [Saccharothrix hoggarensis]|uniref:Uncharacterized protein n=1 Tax=Saccharothrix hoggarensis TaxID=913853 RepID=A0ABW3QRI2_9PSEU